MFKNTGLPFPQLTLKNYNLFLGGADTSFPYLSSSLLQSVIAGEPGQEIEVLVHHPVAIHVKILPEVHQNKNTGTPIASTLFNFRVEISQQERQA